MKGQPEVMAEIDLFNFDSRSDTDGEGVHSQAYGDPDDGKGAQKLLLHRMKTGAAAIEKYSTTEQLPGKSALFHPPLR